MAKYNRRSFAKQRRYPPRRYRKLVPLKPIVRKVVRRELYRQAETKFIEASINGNNSTYSGRDEDITVNVATGTTDSTRIGDEITLVGFHLRMALYSSSSSSALANVVRVVVVQDFENTSSINLCFPEYGNIIAPMGFPTYDYRKEFKVLFDKKLIVSGLGNGQAAHVIDKWVPLHGIKTQYTAGTTAVTQNAIHMYIITDEQTYGPVMYCKYRLYFKDM